MLGTGFSGTSLINIVENNFKIYIVLSSHISKQSLRDIKRNLWERVFSRGNTVKLKHMVSVWAAYELLTEKEQTRRLLYCISLWHHCQLQFIYIEKPMQINNALFQLFHYFIIATWSFFRSQPPHSLKSKAICEIPLAAWIVGERLNHPWWGSAEMSL